MDARKEHIWRNERGMELTRGVRFRAEGFNDWLEFLSLETNEAGHSWITCKTARKGNVRYINPGRVIYDSALVKPPTRKENHGVR